MQILIWVIRIVLFLLMMAFALKNDGLVQVQAFLDTSWSVPLVAVMFACFAAGLLIGIVFLLPRFLSLRHELGLLRQASEINSAMSAEPKLRPIRGNFSDPSDSF